MKKNVVVFVAVILSLLGFSCTVRQDVTVYEDGQAMIESRVTLSPMLGNYVKDLASVISGGDLPEDYSVLDPDLMKKSLQRLQGVDLRKIEVTDRLNSFLRLMVEDLNQVLPRNVQQGSAEGLVSYSAQNGQGRISIGITMDSFETIRAISPNPEMIDLFGPDPDYPVTEDEYYEMLNFAFADYASDQEIREIMQQSFIDVQVHTPGDVLQISGGTIEKDGAHFRIPLIDILTLSDPLSYSVVFELE